MVRQIEPADRSYYACKRCSVKFFSATKIAKCPRCDGELMADEISPPWIKKKASPITFDDLPLQEAIRKLFADPTFPHTENMLIAECDRELVIYKVLAYLPHELIGVYRPDYILLSVNGFRKLDKQSLHKRELMLEHARNMKRAECFYARRVAAACSDEVQLDRIKPGKRNGEYTLANTVLCCSFHNGSRGCKSVEEFWRQ